MMLRVLSIRSPHRNRAPHESAHAVIGIALGRPVDFLEIGPSTLAGGVCVFVDDGDVEDFDALTMMLAGLRAELRDPGCAPYIRPEAWMQDWISCERILSSRYGRTINDASGFPILVQASERAAGLVETYWGEICEVASLVVDTDDFRLDGTRVDEVVRRASLGRAQDEIDKRLEVVL